MSTNPNITVAASTLNRDRVNTVALVVFCQVVHGLTFSAIPLLLPLIREDLQISFTQAGMLSAAATLSYAFGQIPAGFLSDRFGPKRLFFIGLLGWSALSLCFGLIHVFWLALVTQLIAGAFRALLFAPGLALLASWFPPERRATAMSFYMLGGFAGTIVLSLGGPLLTAHYGWRAAFISFSALGIATAFVYKALAKEKPRKQPLQILALTDVFQLFRYPIMWVCSGLQFVRFSVVTAFNFWLPSLLVADRGLSVQTAGLVVAMSAAFTAPSNTLGGYVSDRLQEPAARDRRRAHHSCLHLHAARRGRIDSAAAARHRGQFDFPAILFRAAVFRADGSAGTAHRGHDDRIQQPVRESWRLLHRLRAGRSQRPCRNLHLGFRRHQRLVPDRRRVERGSRAHAKARADGAHQ